MGFSIGESQMLTAPPYAGAAIVMFICAWVGDKYHVRGPLLFFTAALGLIGLPLLVSRTRCSLQASLTEGNRDMLRVLPLAMSAPSLFVPLVTVESQQSWRIKPTTSEDNGNVRLLLQLWSVSVESVVSLEAQSFGTKTNHTTDQVFGLVLRAIF